MTIIDEMLIRKKELGYNYKKIADLSGVPLGTVQKVLGGITKSPRYDTLQALSRVLCMPSSAPAAFPAADAPAANESAGPGVTACSSPSADAGSDISRSHGQISSPSSVYRVTYSPELDGLAADAARKYRADSGDARKNQQLHDPENRKSDKAFPPGRPVCGYGAASGWLDPARQGSYTAADRDAMPDEIRTELIDGVIYDMASPSVLHQTLASELHAALHRMIRERGGSCTVLEAPMDVCLDEDDRTVVQPDVLVVCDRSRLQGRWILGAPDLIIEIISPSSKRRDYILKAHKYANAGVREYWIVDPMKKAVVVYLFTEPSSTAACGASDKEAKKDKSMMEDLSFDVGIYGFDASIPVGIFGGDACVDFAEIHEYVKFLM